MSGGSLQTWHMEVPLGLTCPCKRREVPMLERGGSRSTFTLGCCSVFASRLSFLDLHVAASEAVAHAVAKLWLGIRPLELGCSASNARSAALQATFLLCHLGLLLKLARREHSP